MSGKTLLFADDSATMRLIMEKTFAAEDFDVIAVPSGQAAIEQAKSLFPDIVIADAGMAGVNGYDVCQAIRNEGTISGTPVIIMSGISTPYDENRGAAINATDHIKKPFDTAKLIERVHELCANGTSTSDERSITDLPDELIVEPDDDLKPSTTMADAAGVATAILMPPGQHSYKETISAMPRPATTGAGVPSIPLPRPGLPIPAANPFETVSNPRSTANMRIPTPVREPEPIELEPISESEEDIQVGTLAELAQMNADGSSVTQEQRDDAIDLDSPPAQPIEKAPIIPKRPSVAPVHEDSVRTTSAAAASDIVSRVEGLTEEQATAILKLTEDVIEKVVWEVVPDLAEAIIREKIEKLLQA